jgi:hypothetical protein
MSQSSPFIAMTGLPDADRAAAKPGYFDWSDFSIEPVLLSR